MNPFIPLLLKCFEKECFLGFPMQKTMIYRVKGDKLEVLESPIIGYHWQKKIWCRVLNTEFPSVSDVDAHSIAEAKQNGS
jgi:hypothetical protein